MMATSLEGTVALVSGAGSAIGMGRVIAFALIRAGARVAMMDIDGAALDERVNEAREIGGDVCAIPIIADHSQWDHAVHAVQTTLDQLGELHVLVNLAGVHQRTLLPNGVETVNFWDLPPDVWTKMVTVNSTGPFLMARAAVGHMVEQGWGRIIGITTSLDTMLSGIPYGPTKATHEALVSAMAKDLEGTGVTSNALLPGGGANTNFVNRDVGRDFSRLVQPEVMGPPAVWLSSEEANDFNGMRIIAQDWDETRPAQENLQVASAPAAWPQLGRRDTTPPSLQN
jgi:3-oxoacyl-[acyl-carrier protein] reductase